MTPSSKAMGASPTWAIEARGLSKTYGKVMANHDVSFKVARGSIHALIGENGAGKSTTVKMIYGLVRPDEGEIWVHGRRVRWRSAREAARAGLGMVHQHFMLAMPFSGLDNIVLGAEPAQNAAPWAWLPEFLRPVGRSAARARLAALAEKQRVTTNLEAPVETLSVGEQQRLEIMKLLYRDADILILDEPTAVLTPNEVSELFANLRRLRDQGKTILIITHKLGEVLALADRATVLRRGSVVATVETAAVTTSDLANLMVGRAVELTVKAEAPSSMGEELLALRGVRYQRRREKARLQGLDISVRAGEIVGIAGVEGNGQSELLALLTDPRAHFHGRGAVASGKLEICGRDATGMSTLAVRQQGVGLVPADRHRQGMILDFDLTRNFLLGHQRAPDFAQHGVIRFGALRRRVTAALAEFDVRPADIDGKASALSGGNQQKLVMARELEHKPRVLVCAQPTRGVDVGSIEFIHKRILAARDQGTAVLLVSSALEEILALSDRIVVLFEGRINGVFRRDEADETTIGRAMGGLNHGAGASHG